jgi:hypothetical protein
MTLPINIVADRRLGPLIRRNRATGDIAKALNVPRTIAEMILYGLVATNAVQACNEKSDLIDGDECTLVDLDGRLEWLDADELREWLRNNAGAPLHGQRDREIAKRLPRTVPWDEFCDGVRDACNGWVVVKKKRKPALRFGDKQIKRIASAMLAR